VVASKVHERSAVTGGLGPPWRANLDHPLFDPASTISSFCGTVDVPYFFFWLNVILLRLSGPS
jgi:hypothetical protein